MLWLMVAVGGALGSVARYAISVGFTRQTGNAVPYATAIVNVAGCAIAGLLLGLTAGSRLSLSVEQRTLLFTGMLGGLTTFSGLGIDTLALVEQGRTGTAVLNVCGQIVLGLATLFLVYAIARRP